MNSLAADLVEAAFEFRRRRLWCEVAADAAFLVRVPGDELPWAVNILGGGGEEFGLGLLRGEGAFRLAVRAQDEAGVREQFTEAGDVLALTFQPWRALSEELRGLAREAGLRPQTAQEVPAVFARPPYEVARPADRSERRSLLMILRGVLAAHDAGDLCVRPLDHAVREALELTIEGELLRPKVTARVVLWPGDVGSIDQPPLVALPSDLASLPRLEGRWLLANAALQAEIRGDARAVYATFVAAEATDLVIGNGVSQGEELAPIVDVLAEACRGQSGLPREVVFNSPRLYRSFSPALAGLGVETQLDPEYPPLLALLAALQESARTAPRVTASMPEEALEWIHADMAVGASLAREVLDRKPVSERAMRHYFGSSEVAGEVMNELEALSPLQAFVEWLAADLRPTKRSKTLLEKRLAKKNLDPRERTLLEARQAAHLSVFRVESSAPGVSIDVVDIFTGERATVHDALLSECELEDCLLPLRLLRVDGWILPGAAGPPLAAIDAPRALDQLGTLGAELAPAGLRRDAHLVGRLWFWVLANARRSATS